MKTEDAIRYERPRLESYRFAVRVAVGSTPPTGIVDIDEPDCSDLDFDV